MSGNNEPLFLAIEDAITLAAIWGAFHGHAIPPPTVDFSRKTVAALFSGFRGSSCEASLRAVEVFNTGRGFIEVGYRNTGGGPPFLPCPAIVVYPAHFIAFDNPDKLPVRFVPY